MDRSPRELPIQALAARLGAEADIDLALIFGSAASGDLRADSDVDVAVLTRSPLGAERKRELVRAVAEVVGRPVDLVDLRNAGVTVTSQVLRYGIRLVHKRPSALPGLLSRNLMDSADFLPYRERILRERRQAWIG